jgi:hypothetical protein
MKQRQAGPRTLSIQTRCLTATVITRKTKYSQPGGKQLSLHDDKFRYDETETHATKKLT